jgi:hypothetical protein
MKTSSLSNHTIAAKSVRPMRRLCGLAIAAIGLSAPLASAVTVPVDNGGFETEYGSNTDMTTNWVKLRSWALNNTLIGSVPVGAAFSSDAEGGSHFTRFTYNDAGVEQNLQTTVSAGDTLSVSFSLGSRLAAEAGWTVDPARVKGNAYFLVGSTRYNMPYDLTGQASGVWYSFTFTTTITNTGNLSLGFQNLNIANNYYTSLDGVSDVTLTPAANDPNAPTSTNATLAALENTATPLAAGDFGYADPNSSALAAVQITLLPTLGTLTYNGSPVANNDIIAAANIGNLSYLSPLGGFGSPYTTIGIKVQNSAIPTGLWSLPAVMTVNVTDVDHAPTSSGGSVVLRKNTVKTFAAADFPFSDVDAGDTLQAIKVTSLPNPTNGTLTLNGTPITSAPSADILVADIGTLTYTPSTDYTGSDPFNFQVRDAALFSADATMALTVTSDIPVQNGGFETEYGSNTDMTTNWVKLTTWTLDNTLIGSVPVGTAFSSDAEGGSHFTRFTYNDAGAEQNLNTTVSAGDTLSVTFNLGVRLNPGGGWPTLDGSRVKGNAYFMVGSTRYNMPFDLTGQASGVWYPFTFTTTITNTGNLSIGFKNLNVNNSYYTSLDGVTNVTVTTGGGPTPGSFADWALTNAPDQDPSQDYNNDGVQNGVAYFMGVTGPATNPGLDASNTVTWPKSATYQGTFVVQTSTDLGTWTPADPQPTPSGGNLTYILPPNAPGGKSFVRLLVTPN